MAHQPYPLTPIPIRRRVINADQQLTASSEAKQLVASISANARRLETIHNGSFTTEAKLAEAERLAAFMMADLSAFRRLQRYA